MGEYFDKEKFTGGAKSEQKSNGWGYGAEYSRGASAEGWGGGSGGSQRQTPPTPPKQPARPRQEEESNAWWYSWPAIIILFSVGVWPLALVLLFYNLFWDKKKPAQRGHGQNMESVVERAMRNAERTADRAAGKTEEAIRRAAAQVEQSVSRAEKQVKQAKDLPPLQAKPRKAARPPKQKKAADKHPGALMRMIGIFCLAVCGIVGLDFMSELLGYGYADFENFFASIGFFAAGGLLFFRGSYLGRLSRRSQRYILAIGNTDAMPIDTIAKRVNRKPKQAMKELQKLIDKGYMGEDAYIDYERGYFLRFGATLEEEPEPAPEPVRAAPPPSAPEEVEQGYSGILRNIRRANDRIADPELSRKIDRLERVTSMIFREVEEHPEKRERIRMFFDYYLPTTQKLLDTYADFEETGVEGENLREAKARIEQTMDAIVDGFEHQLDQLYSSDAMDVVSDIKVMEAMLSRDTATVAKDFGFEPPKQEGKHVKKDEDDFPRLQI